MGRDGHRYEMRRWIHPWLSELAGDKGGPDRAVSGTEGDGVCPNFANVDSDVGASHPMRTCAQPAILPR